MKLRERTRVRGSTDRLLPWRAPSCHSFHGQTVVACEHAYSSLCPQHRSRRLLLYPCVSDRGPSTKPPSILWSILQADFCVISIMRPKPREEKPLGLYVNRKRAMTHFWTGSRLFCTAVPVLMLKYSWHPEHQ